MNYIVFDLEWNQSERKKQRNEEIPFEIIEIGAIKLDTQKNVIGEFSHLIKPNVYHDMHRVTQDLIHIQMEELETGKPFDQVVSKFLSWCGEDYIFCTWGPLDLTELQRNMKYYGIRSLSDRPFPFLDVQKLFSIEYEDKKTRRTLEHAIDFLNIEKEIPFHRAFYDAYYTFRILARISLEVERYKSYDVFNLPQSKKAEIHANFATYHKYISREFKAKSNALSDKEVVSTKCYICNKPAKRLVRWFTSNGKHYYSISCCTKHGYLKGKIRCRKSEQNKLYVIKTLKFIEKGEVDNILAKRTKIHPNSKSQNL